MHGQFSSKRTWLLLGTFSLLTILSARLLIANLYLIYPLYAPTFIDHIEGEWETRGHERRQLEDLRGEIPDADYKARKEFLIGLEDQVVKEYPRTEKEHREARLAMRKGEEADAKYPGGFWAGLIVGIIGLFSTISTAILAWRSDLRAGKDLALKIREFERKQESNTSTTPRLIISS